MPRKACRRVAADILGWRGIEDTWKSEGPRSDWLAIHKAEDFRSVVMLSIVCN